MELTQFYRHVIEYAGMTVSQDGYVSVLIGEKANPVMVEGCRLTEPSIEQLRSNDRSSKIFFHPLSESIFHPTSPVHDHLRKSLNIRCNTLFAVIGLELLNLAVSTDQHHKLDPRESGAHETISKLGTVTEKTVQTFSKIVLSAARDAQRTFCYFYINKGGRWKGDKYARVGVTSFDLYDELVKNAGQDKVKILNVSISKKDIDVLINLYKCIFPDIADKEAYNLGVNNDTAPSFVAIMKTSLILMERYNDLIEMFGKHFTVDVGSVIGGINLEWVEPINDDTILPVLRRKVPPQKGNTGSTYTTTSGIEDKDIQSSQPKPVEVEERRNDRVKEPPPKEEPKRQQVQSKPTQVAPAKVVETTASVGVDNDARALSRRVAVIPASEFLKNEKEDRERERERERDYRDRDRDYDRGRRDDRDDRYRGDDRRRDDYRDDRYRGDRYREDDRREPRSRPGSFMNEPLYDRRDDRDRGYYRR